VSNVGPGPSDTYGTVSSDSSNPNATIGTTATSNVKIRLFTATTVKVRPAWALREPTEVH
jgi:hypothetical protein